MCCDVFKHRYLANALSMLWKTSVLLILSCRTTAVPGLGQKTWMRYCTVHACENIWGGENIVTPETMLASFKRLHHDYVIKWKHLPRYWPFVRGNSPVTGGFPTQRPVTRSFDDFFDLRLNKRLSKQSLGWWFETPSRPLWCHCYDAANALFQYPIKSYRF